MTASGIDWTRLGKELAGSARDAHGGELPDLDIAYSFLLDNPECFLWDDLNTPLVAATDWEWPIDMPAHAPDALAEAYYADVEPVKCDWCSAPNPTWRYPCGTFAVSGPGRSVGDWAACDVCHDLIQRDQRGALRERSVRTFVLADIPIPVLRVLIGCLHQRFFDHRTGDPVQIRTNQEDK